VAGVDVTAALREFVERIDALDPGAPIAGSLRVEGQDEPLTLTVPVAHALVEALRSYHDPRDRGTCDHCGGRRLDGNFVCADCGQGSGVFGQLLMERAARFTPSPEIDS
jgi:hypothetical protein